MNEMLTASALARAHHRPAARRQSRRASHGIAASQRWIDPYREPAARLVGEALSGSFAWERLAELGDTFGHRLSGSQSLEDAIQWAVQQMKKDGLENVHTEPVKVPHWVRGQESAEIVAPRRHALVMLGLGNSVGTPAEGVEGEVLVVRSYEELDAAADRGRSRDGSCSSTSPFTNYGETVQFRGSGPSRAAARGAVAALVRVRRPAGAAHAAHRRAAATSEGVPQIPAAAITTEDADRLQRMQDRGTRVRVRLKMEARFLPDADSFNVVGEIRGRETTGRGRRRRRPLRFVGRRHRLDRRRRRVHRDVGGAAPDEEAEPAAAPDGSRRAVDERGERRPGRRWRTAIATRTSSPTTC